MTASPKKSTKTTTAVEVAEKNLTEVQSTITSLSEELAQLQQEHQQIEEQIESGSLVADIDRKAELEGLISRRTDRLEDLQGRVLADAEQALSRAQVLQLAEDQADGVALKHQEYVTAAGAARSKITEGVEELRTAEAAWEEFSRPIVQQATSARLREGVADPESRVLVSGHGRGAHLVIDGTAYAAPEFDRDLADTLTKTDDHLAGTLARGLEARKWNLSVAEIG